MVSQLLFRAKEVKVIEVDAAVSTILVTLLAFSFPMSGIFAFSCPMRIHVNRSLPPYSFFQVYGPLDFESRPLYYLRDAYFFQVIFIVLALLYGIPMALTIFLICELPHISQPRAITSQ